MNQIKAIETRYKGYRFRSRLEARWAVFFDELELSWEYEPEGFVLPGCVTYLPDFRVTGIDTNGDSFVFWFEVKPDDESRIQELHKHGSFVAAIRQPLILLVGVPAVRPYTSLCCDSDSHDGWTRGFDYVLWSYRKRPWWLFCDDFQGGWEDHASGVRTSLVRAVNAARSARFEHGESGAPKTKRMPRPPSLPTPRLYIDKLDEEAPF